MVKTKSKSEQGGIFARLNNLTNKNFLQVLMDLRKAYDHKQLRKQMTDIGHPIALWFFDAWDKTKGRMQSPRYVEIGDMAVSYLVWKCLTDTAYRGPFIDFLMELHMNMDQEILTHYSKDPKGWYVNYSARFAEGRRKLNESRKN